MLCLAQAELFPSVEFSCCSCCFSSLFVIFCLNMECLRLKRQLCRTSVIGISFESFNVNTVVVGIILTNYLPLCNNKAILISM